MRPCDDAVKATSDGSSLLYNMMIMYRYKYIPTCKNNRHQFFNVCDYNIRVLQFLVSVDFGSAPVYFNTVYVP